MATVSGQEQEVRKLSVQLHYLEQTADTLQQRLQMLNAALTDLSFANMTLESLEKEKEGAEMLVPIGGSSYIEVKLSNPDKIVVGLGSGVSVEKSLPEAKAAVKERMDELQKTQVSVQQQLVQIAERIDQDRRRMEGLLTKLKQGPQ